MLDPSQTYFEIEMETLSGADYLYTQDDEIKVRVKSSNQFGYGEYSTAVLSAVSLKVPPY